MARARLRLIPRPDRSLRRRCSAGDRSRRERGATLTEYGLVVSLVVVAALGAIDRLQDESGSYLVETGSDIGTPRELAADLDPDLPEAPAWLSQPPPPSTTTTTAPTTTTTTAATGSSTTADPGSSTTAGATTTTTAPATSTTAATTATTAVGTYPVGSAQQQGPMYSKNNTGRCFEVENPGQVGSSIARVSCSGGSAAQVIAAVGDPTTVALVWTDPAESGLCLAASGSTVVMATCGSGAEQLFSLTSDGSGWVRFTSLSTGLCLTERFTGLELEACSGSNDRQKFRFS